MHVVVTRERFVFVYVLSISDKDVMNIYRFTIGAQSEAIYTKIWKEYIN